METVKSIFLPELEAVALLNGEEHYFQSTFLTELKNNIGKNKNIKKIRNSILKTIDEVFEGRSSKDQFIWATHFANIADAREMKVREGKNVDSIQYALYQKFLKTLQKSLNKAGKQVKCSELTSLKILPDETRKSIYMDQFLTILSRLEQKVRQPKDLLRLVEGIYREFDVRFGNADERLLVHTHLIDTNVPKPTESISSVQQALAYLVKLRLGAESELDRSEGQDKAAKLQMSRHTVQVLIKSLLDKTLNGRFIRRGALEFSRELIGRYPIDQYELVQPCLSFSKLGFSQKESIGNLRTKNLFSLRKLEGLYPEVARATEAFLRRCMHHLSGTDAAERLEGFDWAAEMEEVFNPKQVAAESPAEKDARSDDNGENGEAESNDEGDSSEAESNDDGEVGGEVDGEVKPQSKPESRIQAPSQASVETAPVQRQASAAPPIPSPTVAPVLASSTSTTATTDSTNTSTNSGSSTASSFPWLYAGIGIGILLIVIIAAIFIIRKLRRSRSTGTNIVPMQYVSGTADKAPADMPPPPQYSVAEKPPKSPLS